MADNPIIARSDENKISEAVCIDTKRIYDSCVSKDCLEDLQVTFTTEAQTLINDAVTVKARGCDIASVSIDVEEVPFNNGFFSVDINYLFDLTFDTYSEPCTAPVSTTGTASFEKKCILYGSEGSVKTFLSNPESAEIDCSEAPQYTNPVAKLQAVDPIVLQSETVDNNGVTEVFVTLGLFSIIQLERDVQILIPAYDFCVPERECECDTQSPCETFKTIDFPVGEFFPPDRPENSSCCNNNN